MTKKIMNWEAWDKKNALTIDEAAALFCNEDQLSEPSPNRERMLTFLKGNLDPNACLVGALTHRNIPGVGSMASHELGVLRLLGKDETEFWKRTRHFPITNDCVFGKNTLSSFCDDHKLITPLFSMAERVARAGAGEEKPTAKDDGQAFELGAKARIRELLTGNMRQGNMLHELGDFTGLDKKTERMKNDPLGRKKSALEDWVRNVRAEEGPPKRGRPAKITPKSSLD
jgi:hypothetical protein